MMESMDGNDSSFRVVPFPRSAMRQPRHRLFCGTYALLLVAALAATLPLAGRVQPTRAATEPSDVQTAYGLTVYIGLIPAAIIKQHPEVMMHGGKPSGVNEYHLTVAVFDATSGERISDAIVTADVAEVGLAHQAQTLEHMQIAGTTTYGGFVSLPPMARYHIQVTVSRLHKEPSTFEFFYDRPHQ